MVKSNFASKQPDSCLAVTPSIPHKAVTHEVVDTIHTRTTVMTSVIDLVIYLYICYICLLKLSIRKKS